MANLIQILNSFYIYLVCSMHNPKLEILGCDNLPHLIGISSRDSIRLEIMIKLIIKVVLRLLTRYDLGIEDYKS